MGRVRDGATRMVAAHVELLKAELAVTGREIGIIVGLGLAAALLAFLVLVLLYVGSFLFVGEWLFGSIGWGVLHGMLLTVACIVPIGLNLAGGSMGAWGRGFVVALLVTVFLAVLFASNLLRDAAVSAGGALEATFPDIEPSALPALVGLVVGAIVGGIIFTGLALRLGGVIRLLVAGAAVGAIVGLILAAVTFDTKGAVALALTFGLLTWIVATALLAVRRGFDPEARYEKLVPRESVAAMEESKSFLMAQWQRQRKKLVGR